MASRLEWVCAVTFCYMLFRNCRKYAEVRAEVYEVNRRIVTSEIRNHSQGDPSELYGGQISVGAFFRRALRFSLVSYNCTYATYLVTIIIIIITDRYVAHLKPQYLVS